MMERPLKRQRLSLTPEENEAPDDIDLQEARAQNDLRLKSIFEGIFKKYGRDFTDVGDEIDLQTGKIVVNNGHINDMEGEDNIGAIRDWLSEPDSPAGSIYEGGDTPENVQEASRRQNCETKDADDHAREEEEDRAPSRRKSVSILSQMIPRLGSLQGNIDDVHAANLLSEDEDDRSSVDSLLDTALYVQNAPGRSLQRNARVGSAKERVIEKANPGAEGTHESRSRLAEELNETVEPIWRVPEISGKFSTPTLNRSRPRTVVGAVRSQSPPGTGSLWALPWKSRRNTDVTKKKGRKELSPKKRKTHHSSPVVCDWSFAETVDGSESDDPLQEDYEPSPTPKAALYIREKRKDPFATTHTKNTCDYCKQSFSHDDYISHLRAVLSSASDGRHNLIDVQRQLDKITSDRVGGSPPQPAVDVGLEVRSETLTSTAKPQEAHESNQDSTPSKSKRARTIIGPEEARLLIRMRQVQGLKWKEILDHLPQRKLLQLMQWNRTHWIDRLANPPRLSKPWSPSELESLGKFKNEQGLTWSGIRAALPGRSHAEVEFKLLRLWAGDGVDSKQNTQSTALLDPQGRQEATKSKYSPRLQSASGADQLEHE